MSKNPEKQVPAAEPEAKPRLSLEISLTPVLSGRELIEFHRVAGEAGESPEERLLRLVREDIAAA